MGIAVNTDFLSGLGNPEPHLRAISEAGFTHLHWCHQWCTDFLYGKPELTAIAGWLKKYRLTLLDIHGSAGVEKCWYSTTEYQRQAGVELVINRLEMFATLSGTGALMMHVPNFSPLQPQETRPRIRLQVDSLKRSLDELMPVMQKLGVRIALENMWADDFVILNELLEVYPEEHIGICYDSGHANADALKGIELMHQCKHRLQALHLHDNDGKSDLHQPPFMNSVDWNRVAEVIAASSYDRELSFEISMRNTPFYHPDRETQDPDVVAEFLKDAYQRCCRLDRIIHSGKK